MRRHWAGAWAAPRGCPSLVLRRTDGTTAQLEPEWRGAAHGDVHWPAPGRFGCGWAVALAGPLPLPLLLDFAHALPFPGHAPAVAAIKTPYLRDGKFDLAAYDALVRAQIAAGVDGLIVGGTTGEGQLMSWDEHIMLIAHTVNSFGDRLAVIGNTGSNSTREAVHATEQGFGVGMHASLQINPYYGKTSARGLRTHFDAVLAEGPAIIYNVPGRTGQDIPDDVVLDLAARHPTLLGVKECTGNARIGAYVARGVPCWSGNDDEAHEARHGHGSLVSPARGPRGAPACVGHLCG